MRNSELFRNWGTFSKGLDAKSIEIGFANHLEYSLCKDQYTATARDLYQSLALAVRDRLVERWIRTQQMYYNCDAKRIYYLSAEYLIGRFLLNALSNLNMYDEARKAMEEVHINLVDLAEQEPDAGLGNGGLGRLAACYLDSMATQELPAYGYGIRYEFGIFEQIIKNCKQMELPEAWLKFGSPWEIPQPERSFVVNFYGQVRDTRMSDGTLKVNWTDTSAVIGVPFDYAIPGYGCDTVNTLRLWSARASKDFNLQYFQHGDYLKAVEEKYVSENISKVLYPNDDILQGQELRLKQQYFFVSCSIQDIIRRYLITHRDFSELPDKVAIQMNDTHPSLAVTELMRLLIDRHGLTWEDAWEITVQTCAFTNHTLLTEALEKWPVSLLGRLLPRHLQIIYEINRRFLRDVSVQFVGDREIQRRMSLVEEQPEKSVRMAHLAIVGSHSVNGVSKLHTSILRQTVFKDFDRFFPGKLNNKTNGVTPRRWLLQANPLLAGLISEKIGKDWTKNLTNLKGLEEFAEDPDFQKRFNEIKKTNKENLARHTKNITGYALDPNSMFDVQVKRIHEYKRQLLNIFHVIYHWLRIKEDPSFDPHPRTFFFGGKAAPGYVRAKLIVQFICQVADMINRDAKTNDQIKAVFLPNYRVSLAEKIFPASELSEQVSTAGYEASGTGNMKFCLNGALTIGTLDGANVEIMEEVGEDNIFIFGLNSDEVVDLRPHYRPRDYVKEDPYLQKIFDLIYEDFFSPDDPGIFHPLADHLLNEDNYLVLADFSDYCKCQWRVDHAYADPKGWTKKAILNVARMGKFSSDRAVSEYNRDIWRAKPVVITRENGLTC